MRKYPPQIYSGITDDPNSWGMCCSEEAARSCAEAHFDMYRVKTFTDVLLLIPYGILSIFGFGILFGGVSIIYSFIVLWITHSKVIAFASVVIVASVLTIIVICDVVKNFYNTFDDYIRLFSIPSFVIIVFMAMYVFSITL